MMFESIDTPTVFPKFRFVDFMVESSTERLQFSFRRSYPILFIFIIFWQVIQHKECHFDEAFTQKVIFQSKAQVLNGYSLSFSKIKLKMVAVCLQKLEYFNFLISRDTGQNCKSRRSLGHGAYKRWIVACLLFCRNKL